MHLGPSFDVPPSDDTGGIVVETWPGQAYPLGATFDGSGTNFALFSEIADRVELRSSTRTAPRPRSR